MKKIWRLGLILAMVIILVGVGFTSGSCYRPIQPSEINRHVGRFIEVQVKPVRQLDKAIKRSYSEIFGNDHTILHYAYLTEEGVLLGITYREEPRRKGPRKLPLNETLLITGRVWYDDDGIPFIEVYAYEYPSK